MIDDLIDEQQQQQQGEERRKKTQRLENAVKMTLNVPETSISSEMLWIKKAKIGGCDA